MALLCESLGADVWQVRELVNKSPSRNMHLPGAGVGGHCIPKDGWLLVANAPDSFTPRIIPQARLVNEGMPAHVLHLIKKGLAKHQISPQEAKIALFGYAYLENSDDTRHSPTAVLVEQLEQENMMYAIHDPFVAEYKQVWMDIASGADVAVFMVAHDVYKGLKMPALKSQLQTPIIVDGRHIFDRDVATKLGFTCYSIGIGSK